MTLTNQQKNILIGSILGDGYLSKPKTENQNSYLAIQRSIKDENYLIYQYNIFKEFCNKEYSYTDYFNKETNKIYHHIAFNTRADKIFTEYRKLWYPNNVKVIPNNLELNPEIIAIWICDDGHVCLRSKNSIRISLATQGFMKDEVYYLSGLLDKRYNFKSEVRKSNKDKEQYAIYLNNKCCYELIYDIDEYMPESMSRKILWRDGWMEYHKDKDAPMSPQDKFIDKKSKLIEYFKSIDSFSIRDICKYLDWAPIKTSNGEISTKRVENLFKEYIALDYISKDKIGIANIYTITKLGKIYFNNSTND